tara:strand:+ start:544 stop:1032 length:489 start_codon:yes stop_codon:yes gene_type:complete
MNNLHLDSFIQFWQSNYSSPIPPLPQKQSDLNVTQLEQLRIYDGGKLFQNLFAVRPDSKGRRLPADLENNIRKGLVFHEHENLYREYGYEHTAQQIGKAREQVEKDRINKEIAEMEKRNAEREKLNEVRKNMPLMEKLALESQGQTMDDVIRARMRYHGKVD